MDLLKIGEVCSMRWIIFCFFLAVAFPSFGHPLNSAEQGTIRAQVSRSALNSIRVLGERIQTVRGIEGNYTQNTDPKTGVVYLLPKTEKPFRIFVSTDKGHHFDLLLKPVDGFVAGIVIGEKKTQSILSENELAIFRLMKALATGQRPQHSRVSISQGPREPLSASLSVQLAKTLCLKNFEGKVFRIQNHSNHVVSLSDRILYRRSVRAIALAKKRLGPHQSTWVYTVSTRAGDHHEC